MITIGYSLLLLLLLLLLPIFIEELLPPLLLMLIFRHLLLPLRRALPLRLRSSQLSEMSNNSPQCTLHVLLRFPETKSLSRHKQKAMSIEFKKSSRKSRIENTP